MRYGRKRTIFFGVALLALAATQLPNELESIILWALHLPPDSYYLGQVLFVVVGLALCYRGFVQGETPSM